VVEQLPSEVFIRWIILLSRVFPPYRPTTRESSERVYAFTARINGDDPGAGSKRFDYLYVRTQGLDPAMILRDE